ncbi:MAG: hypothetical protein P1U68_14090 [Verrucomicrobiales bacterium]|nr:hypothetical protein [Verrucomicrobiales bacterium]
MKIHAVSALLIFFAFCGTHAFADKYQEQCPCGPDSFKGPFRLLLIGGQGHKGADFRYSCRKHDLCYDTVGKLQKECDDLFLEDLLYACETSRRPKMARFKAKLSYWLVCNLGGGAYRSAQRIAARNMAGPQK